ncbi:unnamed protein product [Lepeophtheirus salmonis]|uniref:(salmon louse) hypothetical protein n=1 Tax=Lepeophtheirus salmonis TaxID=72036 RepID=A0A7R8CRC4_LEPSM|nr:unnamed protein product [Lepeophtheirus salmonis]CAF2867054.1 unnamed protein product [Lepeophtheirus salmonis]
MFMDAVLEVFGFREERTTTTFFELHYLLLDTTKSPWNLGIFERIGSFIDVAKMRRTARLKVHRGKEVQRREVFWQKMGYLRVRKFSRTFSVDTRSQIDFQTRPQAKTSLDVKLFFDLRFLEEKMICDTMSKSSAAISLTFIIVVTPWSIQQVITSCTKTTPPSVVDFVVSWIAASHSFWSPFIYWLLNEKFRRATLHYYITKIRCLPLPLTWSSEAGMDTIGDVVSAGVNGGITDTNGIHEKFWGEILDRAVSNHSLQVLNERSQTSPSGINGCLTTTFDSE